MPTFGGGRAAVTESMLLVSWTAPAPHDSPRYLRDCVAVMSEAGRQKLTVLMLMGENATAPDRELRGELAAMWRQLEPRGVASVFMASGLRSSVGKTIMNGISRMSGSYETFRSFTDLKDAALWLSQRSHHTPGRIISTANSFLDELGRPT